MQIVVSLRVVRMERQTCFYPQKVSLRVLSTYLFWCTHTDFIGLSHSCLLAMTDARSCLERPLSCLSSWIPKQGSVGKEIQLNLHMQPPLVRPPIQKTKLFPVKAKQASKLAKSLSQEENLLLQDNGWDLFLNP